MIRWDNSSYQKIEDAKFADDQIVVSFENGDVIEIPKGNLIPFGITDIQWSKLNFNPFEIIIPASPSFLEIPWDKLRVITDKEFGKYLAEKSEEQSKLIGLKVKRLREKKGINSKELAERAGIAPQTISRIEQGHTDVSFATLRKILAAMGYSLKDLAHQEAELEMETSQKSFKSLVKRLSNVGVDLNLLTGKIIPKKLQTVSGEAKTPDAEKIVAMYRLENHPNALRAIIYALELIGGSVPTPDLETLKSEIEVELSALPKRESEYESGQGLAYNKVLNMLEKFELRTVPIPSDKEIEKYATDYSNVLEPSEYQFDEDAIMQMRKWCRKDIITGAKWVKEWLRGRLSPELGKEGNKG